MATETKPRTSAPRKKVEKIAIFADLDNASISAKNMQEVVSIISKMGSIAYGKLYGLTDDRVGDFEEIVRANKFDTAGKMRLKVGSASLIDMRLVLDAITMAENKKFNSAFIWAGAGDLIPLFARLQELKIKTITVDLPGFDCKNNFVNQTVTLFSPHAFENVPKPIAPRSNNAPAAAASPAQKKDIVGADINLGPVPELPRKKGAPAFGENLDSTSKFEVKSEDNHQHHDEIDDDNEPVTPEHAREALRQTVLSIINGETSMASDEADNIDDLISLNEKTLDQTGEKSLLDSYNSNMELESAPVKEEKMPAEEEDQSFVSFGDDFASINKREGEE